MTLTSGFDFAAQLADGVIDSIFRAAFNQGMIAHKIVIPDASPVINGELDIYLRDPSLYFTRLSELIEFGAPEDLENGLTLIFFFTVVAKELPYFLRGKISVIASAKKDQVISGNKFVDVILLDFEKISEQGRFKITIDTGVPKKEVYETFARVAISTELKKVSGQIAITPQPDETSTVGFFDARIYKQPYFLEVFINKEFKDEKLPDNVTVVIPNLGQDEPDFSPHYAFALSPEVVKESINKSLEDTFGSSHPPFTLPTDDSITIKSLTIKLAKGYLTFDGTLEKALDVMPDPDVDFTGKVILSLVNGVVKPGVQLDDIDVPWWLDLLQFLPVINLIFDALFGDALYKMVGNPSLNSTGFSDFTVFSNSLPQVAGQIGPSIGITIKNEQIHVRKEGVYLTGTLKAVSDPGRGSDYGEMNGRGEEPTLIAHKKTKAFHKMGSVCPWLGSMLNQNKTAYDDSPMAIAYLKATGYNGCYYCQPEHHTKEPGSIVLHIKSTGHIPDTEPEIPIGISGSLLKKAKFIELGNDSPFKLVLKGAPTVGDWWELTPLNNKANKYGNVYYGLLLDNLAAGYWQFNLTSDLDSDWNLSIKRYVSAWQARSRIPLLLTIGESSINEELSTYYDGYGSIVLALVLEGYEPLSYHQFIAKLIWTGKLVKPVTNALDGITELTLESTVSGQMQADWGGLITIKPLPSSIPQFGTYYDTPLTPGLWQFKIEKYPYPYNVAEFSKVGDYNVEVEPDIEHASNVSVITFLATKAEFGE